ncbi:MAG: YkgJ family cysteine cluster protein [Myxococcales bacterium]
MDCLRCGTCCVVPDIAALDKPLGVRCPHLGDDLLCARYEERPAVCRAHRPDEICRQIAAPTLDERRAKYLALFGLAAEAERIARLGITSMKRARALRDEQDADDAR